MDAMLEAALRTRNWKVYHVLYVMLSKEFENEKKLKLSKGRSDLVTISELPEGPEVLQPSGKQLLEDGERQPTGWRSNQERHLGMFGRGRRVWQHRETQQVHRVESHRYRSLVGTCGHVLARPRVSRDLIEL